MWPIINDVETGKTPEYPDVQPQQFRAPRERIIEAAERAAGSLRGWTVTNVDHDAGVVTAVRTTRLFRFRDDITIRVEPGSSDEQFVVNVRSKSRVGKGDFGQNARNIRELQAALSEQL